MSLLIFSSNVDVHAIAVKVAADELSLKCEILSSAYYSDINYITLIPNSGIVKFNSQYIDNLSKFWNRRPVLPNFNNLPDCDILLAERETVRFLGATLEILSNKLESFNDYRSAVAIDNKSYQLRIATSIGFIVPRAIISTSVKNLKYNARKMFDNVDNMNFILKTLSPMAWVEDDIEFGGYASKITLDQLDDGYPFTSPIMIQEYVEKLFEVRLTVLGDQIISARIDSQNHDITRHDWRIGFECNLANFSIIETPQEIKNLVFNFMKFANLKMATFDFVVNGNNEWVFLECNESGNYLFLDHFSEDFCMLGNTLAMFWPEESQKIGIEKIRKISTREYKDQINQYYGKYVNQEGHNEVVVESYKGRKHSHAY